MALGPQRMMSERSCDHNWGFQLFAGIAIPEEDKTLTIRAVSVTCLD